jgi:hypothetical protein
VRKVFLSMTGIACEVDVSITKAIYNEITRSVDFSPGGRVALV